MLKHRVGVLQVKAWMTIACLLGPLFPGQSQTANNDFYTAPAGSDFTAPAPGVLANDTGSGTLTATLVNGPANGSLTLNPDGSFIYTPTNNFTGVDGFAYQADNGSPTSSVAMVELMVLPPGQFFYDNFSRPTNDGSIFPWVQELGMQQTGLWGITNGLMIGAGPTNTYAYTYYPNDSWTDYSVQAQVRFSSDSAASAGICGRLDATTGAHYAAWIYPENSPEAFSPHDGTAVLWLIKYQNWTYPYTLMGTRVTLPGGMGVKWHNLKMAFQGNNILVFFDGNLLETVTDDGSIDGTAPYTHGGIGLVLWTLPPSTYAFLVDDVIVSTSNSVANYDSYSITTNMTLHVAAPGILANDSGNGPLTALLVNGPASGNLALTTNGSFSYTPADGFTGMDSFTYQCTDGQTTSSVATVTINVSQPVFASDDAYNAAINTTLNVGPPGVLANDHGNNGPLSALLATGPADGSLTLNSDGSFIYTPGTNFLGTDSFTYIATDGHASSHMATVVLTVLPAPIASSDFYTVASGGLLSVTAPGILLNDITFGGSLSAIPAGCPAHGTLTLGCDGSFTYQAATNCTGVDSFTYRVTDGIGTSCVATVEISVAPAGGMFCDNFARTTASIFPWEPESGAWSATNNLLSATSALNDYGCAYYPNPGWTDYSVQAQIQFSDGNAWGGGIGGRLDPVTGAHYAAWVYPEGSPRGPMNGLPAGLPTLQLIKFRDWNHYTLLGGSVPLPGIGTNWHTLSLAFQSNNLAAFFDGDLVTNLTDNGSFDGQPAFVSGGISLDMYTLTPTAYTLSASNVLVSSLVINDIYCVNENSTLIVAQPGVLSNDTDVYGTNLTATLLSGPTNGTVNLAADGSFTYTPAASFTGTDGFTVQAGDGLNPLGTGNVTISVLPVTATPAPVITSINLTNNTAFITWSSVSNAVYRLQSIDDLSSTNWNDVPPDVTATSSTAVQTDSFGAATQRFYRIRLLTP